MAAIEFDAAKRSANIAKHGLDLRDATAVFDGETLTLVDDRFDYGEPRRITVGHLDERMVVIVWTPRGNVRRVISMRKANDREQARYAHRL